MDLKTGSQNNVLLIAKELNIEAMDWLPVERKLQLKG